MAKAKQYGKAVELALATRPAHRHWLSGISKEDMESLEQLRREWQHGELKGLSMSFMLGVAKKAHGVRVSHTTFDAWLQEPVDG